MFGLRFFIGGVWRGLAGKGAVGTESTLIESALAESTPTESAPLGATKSRGTSIKPDERGGDGRHDHDRALGQRPVQEIDLVIRLRAARTEQQRPAQHERNRRHHDHLHLGAPSVDASGAPVRGNDIGQRAVRAGVRIAVLGSTRGTDMAAILEAIEAGKLNAKIVCVVSNIKTAGILEKARAAHIPAFHITGKDVPREEQEAKICEVLEDYAADLVLLIILSLIIFALVPALGSAYTHFSEEVIPQLIGLRDRLAGGALSEITLPVYDATYNYIKTKLFHCRI